MNKYRLIQIGCGGTGGWFYELISKFIALNNIKNIEIDLYDGDIVELQNIKRQNFERNDVYNFKAEILKNKFYLKDIKVNTFNKYFDETIEYQSDDETKIFIGCVDNIPARKVIYQCFEYTDNSIYIDGGNSLTSGQVIVNTNNPKWIKNRINEEVDIYEYFNELEEKNNKSTDDRSCAFFGFQTLATNNMSATYLFKGVNEMITNNIIPFNFVNFSIYGLSNIQK